MAVTALCLLMVCVPLQQFGVVAAHHTVHVGHALVRDFHSVSVEEFSEWVSFRERSVNKSKKLFPHVCFDCRVPGGVKPGNPAAAGFPFAGHLGVLGGSKL